MNPTWKTKSRGIGIRILPLLMGFTAEITSALGALLFLITEAHANLSSTTSNNDVANDMAILEKARAMF